jgi:hypothetical protein
MDNSLSVRMAKLRSSCTKRWVYTVLGFACLAACKSMSVPDLGSPRSNGPMVHFVSPVDLVTLRSLSDADLIKEYDALRQGSKCTAVSTHVDYQYLREMMDRGHACFAEYLQTLRSDVSIEELTVLRRLQWLPDPVRVDIVGRPDEPNHDGASSLRVRLTNQDCQRQTLSFLLRSRNDYWLHSWLIRAWDSNGREFSVSPARQSSSGDDSYSGFRNTIDLSYGQSFEVVIPLACPKTVLDLSGCSMQAIFSSTSAVHDATDPSRHIASASSAVGPTR